MYVGSCIQAGALSWQRFVQTGKYLHNKNNVKFVYFLCRNGTCGRCSQKNLSIQLKV